MKKLLVLMLAMLTAVTSPEQFKMNSICPRQYRLCFYMDVLPGCGRAETAAQTVTATTLKRLSDTLHRR